jgi:hypothetical protein
MVWSDYRSALSRYNPDPPSRGWRWYSP